MMLNTAFDAGERPPSPDPGRVAGHADTALYFACENADDVYACLRAKGWTADAPVKTHYGMTQVHTQDPDGFKICFQHPTG